MPRLGDQQPLSLDQITSFSSQVTARLDERLPRYQKIAPGVLLPDQFTPEIAQERVDFGGLVAALVYFQDLVLDFKLKGTPVTKAEMASVKNRVHAEIAKKYGVSERAIPKKIKREAVNETLQRESIVYEGERPKTELEVQPPREKIQTKPPRAEQAIAKEKPVKPKWFIEIIQTERRGKDKKSPSYNVVRVNGKRIEKLEGDEEKVLLLFVDAYKQFTQTNDPEELKVSILRIHRELTGEPQEGKAISNADYSTYAKLVNNVVARLRGKINPPGKKPWPILSHKEHTTHLRKKIPDISSYYVLSDEVVITRAKSVDVKKRKEWEEKIRKSDRQYALAILLDGWRAGLEIDPKYIIKVLPRVRGRQEKELTPIQAANSLVMHIIALCDPRNTDALDKLDKQELEGLIKEVMRPNETLFEVVGRIYTLFGQDPQKFRLPRTGKNAKYMDYLEGLVQRTRSWFEENHPLLKAVKGGIEAPDAAFVEQVIHKMTQLRIDRVWAWTTTSFPITPDKVEEGGGKRIKIHRAMRKIKQKSTISPIEFAGSLIKNKVFVPTMYFDHDPGLSRSEIAAICCAYSATDGGKKDIGLTNEEFTALIYVMRQKLNVLEKATPQKKDIKST